MYQKYLFGLILCSYAQSGIASSNVELYGLIDQGLRWQLHPLSSSTPHWQISNGNKMASRFGIKGREEITSGHSVFFDLEAETQAHHTQPGSIFKRKNYIGYENSQLGQFTLGLKSSVSFDMARLFDPAGLIRQKDVIDDLSGSLNGRYGNKWMEDSLKYSLRTKSFQLLSSYQLANHQLKQTTNYALGMSYKFSDTLLATSFSLSDNPKITHRQDHAYIFNAGLTHTMGPTQLKMGFSHSQLGKLHRLHPITSQELYQIQNVGLGFKYHLKPAIDLFTAVYAQKNIRQQHDDLFGYKYVVGGNYHFSKKTHAYTFIHHATGSDSGKPLNNITGASLGIVHRF
jgi:predicted porin